MSSKDTHSREGHEATTEKAPLVIQENNAATVSDLREHVHSLAQHKAETEEIPSGSELYLDVAMSSARAHELRTFIEECDGRVKESDIRAGLKASKDPENIKLTAGLVFLMSANKLTKIPGGLTFQKLVIKRCDNLVSIGAIQVEVLEISTCNSLTSLAIAKVNNLKIEDCGALERIPTFRATNIYIEKCATFVEMGPESTISCSLDIHICPKMTTIPEKLTVGVCLGLFGCTPIIPPDAHIKRLNLNNDIFDLDYAYFQHLARLIQSGVIQGVTNSQIEIANVLTQSKEEFLIAAVSNSMICASYFKLNADKYKKAPYWLAVMEATHAYFEGQKLHAVREGFSGNVEELGLIHEYFDFEESNEIAEQYFDDAEYVILIWIDQLQKETLALQEQFKGDAKKSVREIKEMTALKQSMLKGVFPAWFLKKLEQRIAGNSAAESVQFLFTT